MPYDEDLANRIRELLADEPDLNEKKMFGGLAFLIGGNMAIAASGQGGLLVRVPPEETETLLCARHVQPFEMKGREMTGWLRVEPEGLRDDNGLGPWVKTGGLRPVAATQKLAQFVARLDRHRGRQER